MANFNFYQNHSRRGESFNLPMPIPSSMARGTFKNYRNQGLPLPLTLGFQKAIPEDDIIPHYEAQIGRIEDQILNLDIEQDGGSYQRRLETDLSNLKGLYERYTITYPQINQRKKPIPIPQVVEAAPAAPKSEERKINEKQAGMILHDITEKVTSGLYPKDFLNSASRAFQKIIKGSEAEVNQEMKNLKGVQRSMMEYYKPKLFVEPADRIGEDRDYEILDIGGQVFKPPGKNQLRMMGERFQKIMSQPIENVGLFSFLSKGIPDPVQQKEEQGAKSLRGGFSTPGLRKGRRSIISSSSAFKKQAEEEFHSFVDAEEPAPVFQDAEEGPDIQEEEEEKKEGGELQPFPPAGPMIQLSLGEVGVDAGLRQQWKDTYRILSVLGYTLLFGVCYSRFATFAAFLTYLREGNTNKRLDKSIRRIFVDLYDWGETGYFNMGMAVTLMKKLPIEGKDRLMQLFQLYLSTWNPVKREETDFHQTPHYNQMLNALFVSFFGEGSKLGEAFKLENEEIAKKFAGLAIADTEGIPLTGSEFTAFGAYSFNWNANLESNLRFWVSNFSEMSKDVEWLKKFTYQASDAMLSRHLQIATFQTENTNLGDLAGSTLIENAAERYSDLLSTGSNSFWVQSARVKLISPIMNFQLHTNTVLSQLIYWLREPTNESFLQLIGRETLNTDYLKREEGFIFQLALRSLPGNELPNPTTQAPSVKGKVRDPVNKLKELQQTIAAKEEADRKLKEERKAARIARKKGAPLPQDLGSLFD